MKFMQKAIKMNKSDLVDKNKIDEKDEEIDYL